MSMHGREGCIAKAHSLPPLSGMDSHMRRLGQKSKDRASMQGPPLER